MAETSAPVAGGPAPQPFLFPDLAQRAVVADFSGGHLSSDGGLLLLSQLDASLGLTRRLSECFVDVRHPVWVEHAVRELVAQRVLGLAAGYEDLNDPDRLRTDPLVAVAVGQADPLGQDRRHAEDKGQALAGALPSGHGRRSASEQPNWQVVALGKRCERLELKTCIFNGIRHAKVSQ